MKTQHLRFCSAVVGVLFTFSGQPVPAATVSECNEASLRAALAEGGTITFACSGTIALSNTLTLASDTVLDASGQEVVLSGNNAVRVLEVNPGVQATLVHLTIAQGRSTNGGGIYNQGLLTLRQCNVRSNAAIGLDGLAGADGAEGFYTNNTPGGPGQLGWDGFAAQGGGIFNAGVLWVTNSTFAENLVKGGAGGAGGAGGQGGASIDQWGRCRGGTTGGIGGDGGAGGDALGGAICNLGMVHLAQVSLMTNYAAGGTGGSGGLGGLTPCSTVQATPGASGVGGTGLGGAYYNAGSMTVAESAACGNEVRGGTGGVGLPRPGVWPPQYSPGSGGHGGEGRGGGICNAGSNSLVNVTLAANHALGGNSGLSGVFQVNYCPVKAGNGGNSGGGGAFNSGELAAVNCTLWGNTAMRGIATNQGGSMCTDLSPRSYFFGTNGLAWGQAIAASNSVTLQNTIVGGLTPSNQCSGPIIDGGHNLCSDDSASFSAPSSLNHTDPKLCPLADNGGSTATLALLPGSPAIDAADTSAAPATDQRGVSRPQIAGCDIGAYELRPDVFHIGSITVQSNGTVRLRGIGVPDRAFTLEASPTLTDWSSLGTGTVSPQGQFEIEVSGGAGPLNRFFRIVTP